MAEAGGADPSPAGRVVSPDGEKVSGEQKPALSRKGKRTGEREGSFELSTERPDKKGYKPGWAKPKKKAAPGGKPRQAFWISAGWRLAARPWRADAVAITSRNERRSSAKPSQIGRSSAARVRRLA